MRERGAAVSTKTQIRWSGGTYHPDFGVPTQHVLYEVKPAALTKTAVNLAKFAAAREYCSQRGIKFKVMTENDFEKLTFAESMLVEGVKWDEQTFKYFQAR